MADLGACYGCGQPAYKNVTTGGKKQALCRHCHFERKVPGVQITQVGAKGATTRDGSKLSDEFIDNVIGAKRVPPRSKRRQ